MIAITAITPDGQSHSLSGKVGETLMRPLRDGGLVDATCGGGASCGTCHVYLRDGWAEKCGERTEDEGYMLEAIEEIAEVKPGSRLACQIMLSERLDGITLDVAPQI